MKSVSLVAISGTSVMKLRLSDIRHAKGGGLELASELKWAPVGSQAGMRLRKQHLIQGIVLRVLEGLAISHTQEIKNPV